MTARRGWIAATAAICVVAACGDDDRAEPRDAGATREDGATGDAGSMDAQPPTMDGSAHDGGTAVCDGATIVPVEGRLEIASMTCEPLRTCGGALEGTWQLQTQCELETVMLGPLRGICASASVSLRAVLVSGEATFGGGSMSLTASARAVADVELPSSCAGCRCTDMEARLVGAGLVSASCNPVCGSAGSCSCTIDVLTAIDERGTYRVEGATLTTAAGTTFDVCADPSGASISLTSARLGVSTFVAPRIDPSSCVDPIGWEPAGATGTSGGGISETPGQSLRPAAAWGGGSFYVAWDDRRSASTTEESEEIYVKRFDGSNWSEVGAGSASGGGVSNDPTGSHDAALAVDPSGRPVVAWEDGLLFGSSSQIFVRAFDGTSWRELGTGSASAGGISRSSGRARTPAIAVDTRGRVLVAWTDNDAGGHDQIYVRRWDGTTWSEVGAGSASGGGISSSSTGAGYPSMALDPADQPIVAWMDAGGPGTSEIYVRRFDGVSWRELGASSASGAGISATSMWSQFPFVRVSSIGEVYVAWADNSFDGRFQIYGRRYDGASWSDLGAGSSSGGGISNTPMGWSEQPALGLDPSGRAILAWQLADTSADPALADIYVRRFDGSAWTELGGGSASGGGVSDSTAGSWNPSIAVSSDAQVLVVWEEDTPSEYREIYATVGTFR